MISALALVLNAAAGEPPEPATQAETCHAEMVQTLRAISDDLAAVDLEALAELAAQQPDPAPAVAEPVVEPPAPADSDAGLSPLLIKVSD
tara:strand:- start:58 stop:327 length:270 start_codon:yes stop_codon:yes gene_type:complete